MLNELQVMVEALYPHDQALEDAAKYEWASDVIAAIESGKIDLSQCSDFAINYTIAEIGQFEPDELPAVMQAFGVV